MIRRNNNARGGTELSAFRKMLREYRSLLVVAIGSGAAPIAAALVSLSPAWPNAIIGLTTITQLLVAMLVFQLLRSASKRIITRVMVCGIAIICILLPIYLLVTDLFVYSEPQSKMRFIIGFQCTEEAKIVFGDKCPFLGLDEISLANYEEERMWTRTSISVMKSLIVILWLACFSALSVTVASFVLFQANRGDMSKERSRGVRK